MKHYAIAVIAIFVLCTPGAATTIRLDPVDDVMIRQDRPELYYGDEEYIWFTSSHIHKRYGIYRFDLGDLPDTVQTDDILSATLTTFLANSEVDHDEGFIFNSHRLYPGFETSYGGWEENTVTWHRRPVGPPFYDEVPDCTIIFSDGDGDSWLDFDVTHMAQTEHGSGVLDVTIIAGPHAGMLENDELVKTRSKESTVIGERPYLHLEFDDGSNADVPPSADALLTQLYPDNNYGDATYVHYAATDRHTDANRFGIYRFELPHPELGITSANLRIYCYSESVGAGDAITLSAHRVQIGEPGAWNEHTVNWDNRPTDDDYDTQVAGVFYFDNTVLDSLVGWRIPIPATSIVRSDLASYNEFTSIYIIPTSWYGNPSYDDCIWTKSKDSNSSSRPYLEIVYGDDQTSVEEHLPTVFSMDQNVPNPFNPRTRIAFDLPRQMAVSLCVYDISGRLVDILLDDQAASQGHNEIVWRGRDRNGRVVPAGVYFYRLEAGSFSETKRMMLVK